MIKIIIKLTPLCRNTSVPLLGENIILMLNPAIDRERFPSRRCPNTSPTEIFWWGSFGG